MSCWTTLLDAHRRTRRRSSARAPCTPQRPATSPHRPPAPGTSQPTDLALRCAENTYTLLSPPTPSHVHHLSVSRTSTSTNARPSPNGSKNGASCSTRGRYM
ncbi:hypothetical protein BC834DRAFT_898611 [Gloeopeniophorella convolvens]|nr:hypothetical protein BC834DRAFT_898611 [Gloeopeniophorella convolvens]